MTLDAPALPDEARRRYEGLARRLEAVLDAVDRVVIGKRTVVRNAVACLLSGGHLLLEDVPGTGKTTLARALARVLGLEFARIQFTADLLPADVVGLGLPTPDGAGFRFHPGPVFAQVVLADELNRTPPRTQSALLECMTERAVTVDGERHELPRPFFVLATQNPVEFEGTYPLPESQLDRFLMRLAIGYPDRAAEREVLRAHEESAPITRLDAVLDAGEWISAMQAAREVHLAAQLEDYVLDVVARTRGAEAFVLGASPRAALDLARAARAVALLDGRAYVVPDDVRAAAIPVLAHRLVPAERTVARTDGADPVEALLARELGDVPFPG